MCRNIKHGIMIWLWCLVAHWYYSKKVKLWKIGPYHMLAFSGNPWGPCLDGAEIQCDELLWWKHQNCIFPAFWKKPWWCKWHRQATMYLSKLANVFVQQRNARRLKEAAVMQVLNNGCTRLTLDSCCQATLKMQNQSLERFSRIKVFPPDTESDKRQQQIKVSRAPVGAIKAIPSCRWLDVLLCALCTSCAHCACAVRIVHVLCTLCALCMCRSSRWCLWLENGMVIIKL